MATLPRLPSNQSVQPSQAQLYNLARGRRRQRGVAFMEFAIIVPLLLSLIAFPFFFGRIFMYYSVAQKAAQNAAIYLATVPRAEMQETGKSRAAKELAEAIVAATIKEADTGKDGAIGFQVQCDNNQCGLGVVPTKTVAVELRISMYDEYFPFLTWAVLRDGPLVMNVNATVPYLGK